MTTDSPPTPLTNAVRSFFAGVAEAQWTIVRAHEIPGGGVALQGVICWRDGELRPFTLTEGDGG